MLTQLHSNFFNTLPVLRYTLFFTYYSTYVVVAKWKVPKFITLVNGFICSRVLLTWEICTVVLVRLRRGLRPSWVCKTGWAWCTKLYLMPGQFDNWHQQHCTELTHQCDWAIQGRGRRTHCQDSMCPGLRRCPSLKGWHRTLSCIPSQVNSHFHRRQLRHWC